MYACLGLCMPRVGLGRLPQINLFGVRYRVICCVLGTKLTEKKGTSLCTDLSFMCLITFLSIKEDCAVPWAPDC